MRKSVAIQMNKKAFHVKDDIYVVNYVNKCMLLCDSLTTPEGAIVCLFRDCLTKLSWILLEHLAGYSNDA